MGNDASKPALPPIAEQVLENEDRGRLKAALLQGFSTYGSLLDNLLHAEKIVLRLVRDGGDGASKEVIGFVSSTIQCYTPAPGRICEAGSLCRSSLYDLRVHALEILPAFRHSGHARTLLAALAGLALERGCMAIWPVAPSQDGLEFARLKLMRNTLPLPPSPTGSKDSNGAAALAAWFVLHRTETQAGTAAEPSSFTLESPATVPAPSSFPYQWRVSESCREAVARACSSSGISSDGDGKEKGIRAAAREGNWDLHALASSFSSFLRNSLSFEELHADAVALLAVDALCGVTEESEEQEEEDVEGEGWGGGTTEEKAVSITCSSPPAGAKRTAEGLGLEGEEGAESGAGCGNNEEELVRAPKRSRLAVFAAPEAEANLPANVDDKHFMGSVVAFPLGCPAGSPDS